MKPSPEVTQARDQWRDNPTRAKIIGDFQSVKPDTHMLRAIGASIDLAYSEGYLAAIRMVAILHMENAQ